MRERDWKGKISGVFACVTCMCYMHISHINNSHILTIIIIINKIFIIIIMECEHDQNVND